MSQFRPTRASPRLKPTKIPDPSQHKLSPDVSRSSIASAHELLALSQDEIELIDAVIERAGPSATTFLTVFKAYNDILTERGLDPHEVEYYGKLLKLGTTKGRNWGEKWDAIKSQHQKQGSRGDSNGRNHSHRQIQAPKTGLKSASKRVIRRPSPPSESDGTFTLNSHDNESVVPSIDERDVPAHPASRHKTPAYQNHAIRRPWIAPSSVSEDLITISSVPTLDARTVPNHRQRTFLSSESVASVESDDVPSTTPPSYRATTRNVRPTEKLLTSQSRATLAADEARKVVAMARQRRGSIVNGEDAWKKIQMERDEADADQFRADRLQERCWEVWKQGYHWIVTTNRQIGEARDNLILRVKFQRWRAITTSREELYQRVTNISNTRCLRAALETWKSRVREREQVKWREMMRLKMKTVKDKRDLKLLKDVWLKWRQSYLLELAGHQHTKQSQLRFYHRWKKRLSGIIEQEHTADNFFDNSARNVLGRCWKRWRDANDMRYRERIMVERVELRLMTKSLLVWRKEMQERVTAKKFYRILLLKSAIRSWKTARDRIRKMERRADKHLSRQDDVLLRAVARVWKARGRGKLLEGVKAARLVKSSWSVWRQRMRQRKEDEDLAMAFSFRNKTNLLATSLQSWRNTHITHRNAQSFAVQYHASQLQDKMILSWRIELREKIKLQKLARRAEKHFVIRRAWKNWAGAIRIKAMENRVKGVEERVVAKHFYAWLHRAREKKRRREVETTIRENTKKV